MSLASTLARAVRLRLLAALSGVPTEALCEAARALAAAEQRAVLWEKAAMHERARREIAEQERDSDAGIKARFAAEATRSTLDARRARDNLREAEAIATARGRREARALLWAERWKALARRLRGELAEARTAIAVCRYDYDRRGEHLAEARAERDRALALLAESRRIADEAERRAAEIAARVPTGDGEAEA